MADWVITTRWKEQRKGGGRDLVNDNEDGKVVDMKKTEKILAG